MFVYVVVVLFYIMVYDLEVFVQFLDVYLCSALLGLAVMTDIGATCLPWSFSA